MSPENAAANSGEPDKTDASQIKISGGLIARNTFFNLIGQAIPLLIGVLTIPYVVHGLGTDRFGLLSLAWVVMGYFTIFDLGLGRATTKYVAEALGNGERDQVPQIVWTAVAFQTILGLVGAVILFGITDLLVEQVLNIPPQLQHEAKDTFHLIALSVPLVLVSSSFRGVMEAVQRFDLINLIIIPSNTLMLLLPVVGLYLDLGLAGIITLIVMARFSTLIAFIATVIQIFPQVRTISASSSLFSRLFAFGGWVTISNIISPILVYFDRFLIGSLLTLAAVSYYTVPYEVTTRFSIIAMSLATVLFPVFSALGGTNDRQRIGTLFARSFKYALIALGPVIVLMVIYAREILQVWMGSGFAIESKLAMQILALGVLVNSLAFLPFALLQGIGRPDLTAKFHLIELPIYVIIAWILVREFGIAGGAAAWTLRVALDALLLYASTFKLYQLSSSLLVENGTGSAIVGIFIFSCIICILKMVFGPLNMGIQFLLLFGFLILFSLAVWSYIFDDIDRGLAKIILRGFRKT